RYSSALGHAHDLEREDALEHLMGLNGDRRHILSPSDRQLYTGRLFVEHDLFRKPVPIPDRCRGHAFRDHAQFFSIRITCGDPDMTLSRRTAARARRTA